MPSLLIGIDVGTSGTKSILMDPSGRVIGAKTVEYPLSTPRPGWSEQDPADWWRAVKESLAALLRDTGTPGDEIAGIGLSGQMHGMVALDAQNRVLRPAILWNDTRTQAQCDEVQSRAGGLDALLALTNNQMLPGYTGGKILWMRENEPELYEKLRLVLNPKDYIRYLLTGEAATEVSDASGTGLFDVKNRRFSRELLAKLDLPESLFPRCYESSEIAGRVTAEVARETGLAAGTPVAAGGGDAVIQTTGMGLVQQGILGVVLGTSGVVAMGLDGFLAGDGSLQVFCNNAPGLWHAMGVTLAAGGSYKWYRDTLCRAEKAEAEASGADAYDLLGARAARVAPGSESLLFLPYLSGERCPYSDPNARGVFMGLSLRHTHAHMTRAVLEGVSMSLYQASQALARMGATPERMIASGGGALSPLWRQILADVFGIPVSTVSGAAEGGAYGAALVAGVGVGTYGNLVEAAKVLKEETRTEPIAQNRRVYRQLYAVYDGLYPALKGSFDALAGVGV